MDDAWAKLAELEETFTGMLSKTYRLQSQRVCLEMLSGEPGDGHPDTVILFWITHPTTYFVGYVIQKRITVS